MLKKLRMKFILVNMAIVTIMTTVLLGMVWYFTRANIENESLSMMQNIAFRPYTPEAPDGRMHMQNGEKEEIIESDKTVKLPYFMLEIGVDDEIISVDGGFYDLSDDDFLEELVSLAMESKRNYGVLKEYNYRFFRVEGPKGKRIVFSDISSEITTLNHLLKISALIWILSFAVFLLISILLSKWAVKPVEKAWKQQKQFVADASHELKTPLTVIMTNAELAQNPAYGEEERQRLIAGIRTVSYQMKQLIEQMLTLARADTAVEKVATEKMDYSKMTEESVMLFEPLFFENQLVLESEVEPAIYLTAGREEIRKIADILLDNAQKYATKGSAVSLKLVRKGKKHCQLSVCNQGEPIPEEELQNLFKRFYRVDEARTRSGSFGLGLSIAETIVNQYGGKIWAENKGNQIYFQVLLPCHTQEGIEEC